MKLNIKSLTLAAGLTWGGVFFITALANLIFDGYASVFLDFGASIYPGYHGPGGFGSVIVVTLYALLDGAVFGAVLGWLYNKFAEGTATGS